MSHVMSLPSRRHTMQNPTHFVVLCLLLLGLLATPPAFAQTPLDIAGFLGAPYGLQVKAEPTAETPESKLWWNAGTWWGSLYRVATGTEATGTYSIHSLNAALQTWEDTGIALDDREGSRADVLWDGVANKLYVASHFKVGRPRSSRFLDQWARLYRYSYDAATPAYSLDEGFPVTVNQDRTETLVLDKDSTGRLWVTYVTGRKAADETTKYQVYFNSSDDDGLTWGIPLTIPLSAEAPPEATVVDVDDISSLIAFTDASGPKVGVIWSNQRDGKFYFASHADSADPESGWTLELGLTNMMTLPSDDHINMAKTATGEVLLAIKTGATLSTDALIGLVVRDAMGAFSFHPVSPLSGRDTRPIVLYHETENAALIFLTSNTGGGRICMATVLLTDMVVPFENCDDSKLGIGHPIILGDSIVNQINNATSTKQFVTAESGTLILGTDDRTLVAPEGMSHSVYVYNILP